LNEGLTNTYFLYGKDNLTSQTTVCFAHAIDAQKTPGLKPWGFLGMFNKNLAFYSVDIANNSSGKPIVIEIGDGQVSDYVGWDLPDFVKVLASFMEK
jgi:hypothetical protein